MSHNHIFSWTAAISISGKIDPVGIFSRYTTRRNKDGSVRWGQFTDKPIVATSSRDMTLLLFSKDFEKLIASDEYFKSDFAVVDGILYADSADGVREGLKAFENFIKSERCKNENL